MRRLHYQRRIDPAGLYDELVRAGITPFRVEGDDTDAWVEVDDAVAESAVAAVVTAHDADARARQLEQELANEATLRDRAAQALANLNAADDNWATLTAAQKDAALRLNVRVTVALARLVLRRLEET